MISIIIPVYNGAEWLAKAITSAWANNPKEIIIIDDGSTDNSLEIAKQYEGQLSRSGTTNMYGPIVKVISQVNKGLASARNTGIMNANSEWCLFLDADDILAPNICEEIEKIVKISNVDIIAPSLKEFGISNTEVILKENITLEDFKTGLNFLPYCCAVKKSKLLEVGGYSPKMIWGYEDLHLWINLLSRGAKVKTIPMPLVFYRTKENSMITEAKQHHDELMNQIKKDFPLCFQ